MKEIEFKDLNVNDIFVLNNTEYQKIADQRVSCCKVLNAALKDNPAQKIQIKPLTTKVQVND